MRKVEAVEIKMDHTSRFSSVIASADVSLCYLKLMNKVYVATMTITTEKAF